MEIKRENLEKSKVKLTIRVSSPEMRNFFSRAYNKLAQNVEVKGFRPGTAPKSLTIAAIGENKLNSEILDIALQETYSQALRKENIIPVIQPKVNVKMLKDLTVDTAELEYEVEIEILPKVTLGDYKKIKIKKFGDKKNKDTDVKDDEVNQVLSYLQRQKATFTDITRPIKDGDRVEINFDGFERGVKLENLSSKNYPVILGSGTFLPDFEKNLIGLKKDDKKDFTIDVLSQDKKSKKSVDFKVEVLQTQAVGLPELNNEFAKNFQKSSIDELKKAIRTDIISQKEIAAKRDLENKVLEELLKITKVELPEGLIEQEIDRQVNEVRSRTAMTGMTFEKYLESFKKTEAEFRQMLRPQAEKTIKIGLALGEIVKQESASWRIDPKNKDAGKKALEKLIEISVK